MNFEHIYRTYWNKVFRLCLSYFNDEALAQDMAQDVFVRVWRYLPTFRGEASVGTWIFRIATNVCLRQSERQKHVSRVPLSDGVLQEQSDDRPMQVQALYKAIARLPEIDRLMISLYLEDTRQAEIARIIGITEANVRVRIHRIKLMLAKEIGKDEE